MSDRIDIHVELQPDNYWFAYDNETYDVDCDQDGYFSTSPTGSGKTKWDACIDLIEQMYEAERNRGLTDDE